MGDYSLQRTELPSIYRVFNDAVSKVHKILLNDWMTVHNELKVMWKEGAQITALS
jgi:hypothetical protein